jgi:hypothetical protein
MINFQKGCNLMQTPFTRELTITQNTTICHEFWVQ